MPDSSSSTLQRMAWVSCYDGVPCAFDAHGKRVLYTASGAWAPPPQPPTHVHYGGPPGDAAHEQLAREDLEERLGFTLNASLVVSQPELLRSLPMLNLHPDCLPPELVVSSERQEAISAAVRAGYVSSDVFVAPDAYGGCGLFAAAELPPMALVGEYVGTVRRGAEADCGSDPYTMRYPDASGELSLSAKDGGSLMRFVNHAPAGSAAHNCDVVTLLVDGVYHSCIATTRTVAPREQLAYDYGGAYWARRGGCCEPGAVNQNGSAG